MSQMKLDIRRFADPEFCEREPQLVAKIVDGLARRGLLVPRATVPFEDSPSDPHPGQYVPIHRCSPSGKQLFVCLVCGSMNVAPMTECVGNRDNRAFPMNDYPNR